MSSLDTQFMRADVLRQVLPSLAADRFTRIRVVPAVQGPGPARHSGILRWAIGGVIIQPVNAVSSVLR